MRPLGGQVISNMSRPPAVSCLLHRKRSSREPTRMSSGTACASLADWSRTLAPPSFTGESKYQRAALRKLPDKGRVRVFFVLSAFGSRDVVAASPRNYSGFCAAPNFSRKRRTTGWRRAFQRTGARSGSRTWTAAAQSLIVHLVPVQCWLVAPEFRDHFGDQNVRWRFES
jgi:hypothetical protein